MTANIGQATLPEHLPNLDTSKWDPALDAVVAAPANHKVLFENAHLRVLEVNLAPDEGSLCTIIDGAQCSSWTRYKARFMTLLPTGHSCHLTGI